MWLRCALHAHTTNSDGELSPAHLARHYERAGYDVLSITDHWVRTVEDSTERLLVLPGVELNATLAGTGSDAHVLALGVRDEPRTPGMRFPDLQDTIDWIREGGGLPFVAHPYWSGLQSAELLDCAGLLGIEVYNAGCELEVGRGLSSVQWDETLEAGARLLALATDDSHLPGYDSGFASTWVDAAERSAEAVLEALAAGRFWSSTGPRIESVAVGERAVEVRCSPAQTVTLVSTRTSGSSANAGRMGYCSDAQILDTDEEGRIVAARLTRWPSMPFGRVEVTDAHGRRAWTNPLW